MTSRIVYLFGAVVAVGASFGMAALSRAPLTAYPDATPVLRLAWSVRPERIEHCRTLTDAELADVPVHMRQRVQCEGRAANYRLRVTVDGATRLDTLVTGGGARNDRPVYVFRELALAAGQHDLAVRFERESQPGAESADSDSAGNAPAGSDTLMAERGMREAEERTRRREEAVPPEMELVTRLNAVEREVALVTYDIDQRALLLKTRDPAP